MGLAARKSKRTSDTKGTSACNAERHRDAPDSGRSPPASTRGSGPPSATRWQGLQPPQQHRTRGRGLCGAQPRTAAALHWRKLARGAGGLPRGLRRPRARAEGAAPPARGQSWAPALLLPPADCRLQRPSLGGTYGHRATRAAHRHVLTEEPTAGNPASPTSERVKNVALKLLRTAASLPSGNHLTAPRIGAPSWSTKAAFCTGASSETIMASLPSDKS